METITSRKNSRVQALRALGRNKAYRREQGLFLCDGEKLLSEALANGADIAEIYLRGAKPAGNMPEFPGVFAFRGCVRLCLSAGAQPRPAFHRSRKAASGERPARAGHRFGKRAGPRQRGTVLRTAAALGTELVVLLGDCADPYNPKTVRAAMGALFRQRLWETDLAVVCAKLREWELPLCGAALRAESVDVKCVSLRRAAIAVGNEGLGAHRRASGKCDTKIILPMTPGSESLYVAVAASILMWEMWTQRG